MKKIYKIQDTEGAFYKSPFTMIDFTKSKTFYTLQTAKKHLIGARKLKIDACIEDSNNCIFYETCQKLGKTSCDLQIDDVKEWTIQAYQISPIETIEV